MNAAERIEKSFNDFIEKHGKEKFDDLLLKVMTKNGWQDKMNRTGHHQKKEPNVISEKSIMITVRSLDNNSNNVEISTLGKLEAHETLGILEIAKLQLYKKVFNKNI